MTHRFFGDNDSTENCFLGPDYEHFERFIVKLNRYIEKNDTGDRKMIIDKKNTNEHKSKRQNLLFDRPNDTETLKCRVKREKMGCKNMYYYEQETLGLEYYRIMKAEVRQNEMILYDVREDEPKEVARITVNAEGSTYKLLLENKEKWIMKYEPCLTCLKSPKKFTIIGHSIRYDFYYNKCKKSLSKMIKNEEWENLLIFVNKPPVYNAATNAFLLNLQDRESFASIKNFQLIDFFDATEPIMTFTKQIDDIYTLEFCFPLTMIDSFFFALCSIENKSWIF